MGLILGPCLRGFMSMLQEARTDGWRFVFCLTVFVSLRGCFRPFEWTNFCFDNWESSNGSDFTKEAFNASEILEHKRNTGVQVSKDFLWSGLYYDACKICSEFGMTMVL